jgi:rod shape determining protein RodA
MFRREWRGARNYGDLVADSSTVPFLLIAKEPDLAAVTLVPVCFGIRYLAGLRLRLIAIVAVVAVCLRRSRGRWRSRTTRNHVSAFSIPRRMRGGGISADQARITVGSGGLKGKGFMKGTRGHTGSAGPDGDFIFSVLAEGGFIGVLVALGLYLFVILRSLGRPGSKDHRRVSGGRVVSGFAFR